MPRLPLNAASGRGVGRLSPKATRLWREATEEPPILMRRRASRFPNRFPDLALRGSEHDMAIIVAEENCTGCGTCVPMCFHKALTVEDNIVRLHAELCTDCLDCLECCPTEALVEPRKQDWWLSVGLR